MDKEMYIVWHSDNFMTAEKLVFRYAIHAKKQGWLDDVSIVIWGASALLAKRNPQIQKMIKDAVKAGVNLIACKMCADEIESADDLEGLGVELSYWGEEFTRLVLEGKNVVTI